MSSGRQIKVGTLNRRASLQPRLHSILITPCQACDQEIIYRPTLKGLTREAALGDLEEHRHLSQLDAISRRIAVSQSTALAPSSACKFLSILYGSAGQVGRRLVASPIALPKLRSTWAPNGIVLPSSEMYSRFRQHTSPVLRIKHVHALPNPRMVEEGLGSSSLGVTFISGDQPSRRGIETGRGLLSQQPFIRSL